MFKKIILKCLSGAQMGSIHEKNAKKSRDTATLKELSYGGLRFLEVKGTVAWYHEIPVG